MREPIRHLKCGEQVVGIVNVTYRHVPICTDGYHGPDGEQVRSELLKVYCPKCDEEVFIGWDEGKALSEQV